MVRSTDRVVDSLQYSFSKSIAAGPVQAQETEVSLSALAELLSPPKNLCAPIHSDVELPLGKIPSRMLMTNNHDSEFLRYNLRSKLFSPLNDIDLIRERQSVLLSLLKPDSKGIYRTTSAELDALERLCQLFDPLVWGVPSAFVDKYDKSRWKNFVSQHVPIYRLYLGERFSKEGAEAFSRLDDAQEALTSFANSRCTILNSLVDKIPLVKEAAHKYATTLIEAGVLAPFDRPNFFPFVRQQPFASGRQYRDAVETKMCKQDPIILHFVEEMDALRHFVEAARFIICFNLKPLQLIGNGKTTLKKMWHQLLHENSPISMDFQLSSDKPTTIFTGRNGAGKSKTVESVLLNLIYAQSIGFAFCSEGMLGVPRSVFYLIGNQGTSLMSNGGLSTGQRDVLRFVNQFKTKELHKSRNALIVLDEFLSSTDATGALAMILATSEMCGAQGSYSLITLHNQATEKIHRTSLASSIRLLKPAKKQFQWVHGVEQAVPIELAKQYGLPSVIVKRALQIENELNQAKN